MKIFKIENKQKLKEWPDKELKNWLNKEQNPIKFWKEWLTLTIDSMYLVKKKKLEECIDKPLKNEKWYVHNIFTINFKW